MEVAVSRVSVCPEVVIPWGKAGLALLTTPTWPATETGGIFLIDGRAVNPNEPPDVTTGSPASLPFASLATVSPQEAAAGGPDVTLTIKGSAFTESSLAFSDYGHSVAWPCPQPTSALTSCRPCFPLQP